MEKGKILIWLRVSTEKQELIEQKREMIEFVKSMGYSDEDIICLEGKGASAIKVDEDYIEMYNEVIRRHKSDNITAVAVWSVSRLARDEEWGMKIKKYFINNKIQFLVKNPTLVLLNPDGSVNSGTELAFSLFLTMAKNEMAEKKERFKRTKRANAEKGKYNGGCNIRFGYSVGENNFYIINEEEANIIRTIFELYSEGKYSAVSLRNECYARGISMDKQKIMNILSADAYCGRPQVKYNNRVYPAIISEELFDKCEEIRKGNKLITRRGERQCLASKLIKCECGGTFTSGAKAYACCRHSVRKVCGNTITLKKSMIEPLLWRVASTLHLEFLMNDNANRIDECKKELEILDTKINATNVSLSKIDDKKNRVVELYIDGLIDNENKAQKLNKIQEEYTRLINDLNGLNEAKNKICGLIDNIEMGDDVEALMSAMDVLEQDEKSMEYQYDIIHKYITKVEVKREWFGKDRDTRAIKENGIHIYIHTIYSDNLWEFMYVPNGYKGIKLFVWNGNEFIAD